jgi:hypothetical protein
LDERDVTSGRLNYWKTMNKEREIFRKYSLEFLNQKDYFFLRIGGRGPPISRMTSRLIGYKEESCGPITWRAEIYLLG